MKRSIIKMLTTVISVATLSMAVQGCDTDGSGENASVAKDDVSSDATFVDTMNQSQGLLVRVPVNGDASLASSEARIVSADLSQSSDLAEQAWESAMQIDGYGELSKDETSSDTSTSYYTRWRYTYYTYTWTYTYYTWYYYTPTYYYYYYPIYYVW